MRFGAAYEVALISRTVGSAFDPGLMHRTDGAGWIEAKVVHSAFFWQEERLLSPTPLLTFQNLYATLQQPIFTSTPQ